MNRYPSANRHTKTSVALRSRHVRRHRTPRPGSVSIGSDMALGTVQALMGLAAYQARAR